MRNMHVTRNIGLRVTARLPGCIVCLRSTRQLCTAGRAFITRVDARGRVERNVVTNDGTQAMARRARQQEHHAGVTHPLEQARHPPRRAPRAVSAAQLPLARHLHRRRWSLAFGLPPPLQLLQALAGIL